MPVCGTGQPISKYQTAKRNDFFFVNGPIGKKKKGTLRTYCAFPFKADVLDDRVGDFFDIDFFVFARFCPLFFFFGVSRQKERRRGVIEKKSHTVDVNVARPSFDLEKSVRHRYARSVNERNSKCPRTVDALRASSQALRYGDRTASRAMARQDAKRTLKDAKEKINTEEGGSSPLKLPVEQAQT
jgi:hypothetical protein